jgi:hypothetical protein
MCDFRGRPFLKIRALIFHWVRLALTTSLHTYIRTICTNAC